MPRSRKPRRKRAQRSQQGAARAYEIMIADPCNSVLVPGLYGSQEGLLARVKSTYVSGEFAAQGRTCGYVLWCPEFSNKGLQGLAAGDTDQFGNLFVFEHASPNYRPSNDPSKPFGTTAVDTTLSIQDPASSLIDSQVVADCRPLNACIQMTYFGKMLDAAGEVAYIANLPFSELLTGGPVADGYPDGTTLCVNDLMNYSTNKKRLGVDTREAVFKPDPIMSSTFRGANDVLLRSPLVVGGDGGIAEITDEAKAVDPVVFGFAWRNFTPDSGVSFDFTKSIEWRPDATSGLTQVPVRHMGPSKVPSAVRNLDRQEAEGHPVWDRVQGGFKHLAQEGLRLLGGAAEPLLLKAGEGIMREVGALAKTAVPLLM